jgi:nitroimidazol reductase NimA-like FMN-containing flavoprotein (pyridoxamine 5'-phosphate oxidase superfamily)
MQEFNPIIHRARVARLATAESKAKPHIIPVVFAFDGEKYHIPIDENWLSLLSKIQGNWIIVEVAKKDEQKNITAVQ